MVQSASTERGILVITNLERHKSKLMYYYDCTIKVVTSALIQACQMSHASFDYIDIVLANKILYMNLFAFYHVSTWQW